MSFPAPSALAAPQSLSQLCNSCGIRLGHSSYICDIEGPALSRRLDNTLCPRGLAAAASGGGMGAGMWEQHSALVSSIAEAIEDMNLLEKVRSCSFQTMQHKFNFADLLTTLFIL